MFGIKSWERPRSPVPDAAKMPSTRDEDPALPATSVWFGLGGRPDFRPAASKQSRKRPLPPAAPQRKLKSRFQERALALATFADVTQDEETSLTSGNDRGVSATNKSSPTDRNKRVATQGLRSTDEYAPPHYSWETWYDYSKVDDIVKKAVSSKINLAELRGPVADSKHSTSAKSPTAVLVTPEKEKSVSPSSTSSAPNSAKSILDELQREREDTMKFEDYLLECLTGKSPAK